MEKTFNELSLVGGLPSSLRVSMQLMELMRAGERDVEALARIVQCDPALSLRLIKLANQNLAQGKGHTDDVPTALARVGWDAAQALLMGFSLVKEEWGRDLTEFDHGAYWLRAQLTAQLCEALSSAAGWDHPQRAYSLGLIADIGTLTLAKVHRARFMLILQAQPGAVGRARSKRETEVLGINHCEVSHALLDDAGLSPELREAVLIHKEYDRICEQKGDVKSWAALLLASQSAASMCTDRCKDCNKPCCAEVRTSANDVEELFAKCCQLLGLTAEQAEAARVEATAHWTRLRDELDTASDPACVADINQCGAPTEDRDRASHPQPTPSPSVAQNAPARTSVPALDQVRWGESARILLVDDDPLIRRVVGAQLRKAGNEVLLASDGQEGLEKALTLNPQVVVTDWNMPGMTGVELCEMLRATDVGRRLCILMLTSRDGEADQIIEVLQAGADDYVTKPSDPGVLQARVQAGLRTVHMRERLESMESARLDQVAELGILARQLELAALTDPLTQLPNRRYAMRRLEQEWESSTRTGQPMSVIISDLDHFKQINDTYGHGGGDEVLKEVSLRMRAALRLSDVLSRYGGEEFLTLNPASNAADARLCAERVRQAVAKTPIQHGLMNCTVTLSLGIAERTPEMESPEDLLLAADQALYTAKALGRNRCA